MPSSLTADRAKEIGIQPIVARAIHILSDALNSPEQSFPTKEAADYVLGHLEHWCLMTGRRDLFFSDGSGPKGNIAPATIPETPQDPYEEVAHTVLTQLAGRSEILAVLGEIIRTSAPYPMARG